MKAKELRALSTVELNQKLQELKKQLMDLEFKRYSGVDKPHLFKQTKRDIARILTILREKKEVK